MNTGKVRSVAEAVLWVEAGQAPDHAEPWDPNVSDTAKWIRVVAKCLIRWLSGERFKINPQAPQFSICVLLKF